MLSVPSECLELPVGVTMEELASRAAGLARAGEAGVDALDRALFDWFCEARTRGPDEGEQAYFVRRGAHAQRLRYAAFMILPRPGGWGEIGREVVAWAYGFRSWFELDGFLLAIADPTSEASRFERAADAVVDGDLAMLDEQLAAAPALVRARSWREHGATLLHYVTADGVEGFRRRVPVNVAAVASRLLDAGAEPQAEFGAPGEVETTPFDLLVTSERLREAGRQIDVADVLLARGAPSGGLSVRRCLEHGAAALAVHLAEGGAAVGFEEACGLGRLDDVRASLAAATDEERRYLLSRGIEFAVSCGQCEIAELLLTRAAESWTSDDETASSLLTPAARRGDVEMVDLLLRFGAVVDGLSGYDDSSPLWHALFQLCVVGREPAAAYRRVVLRLLEANATLDPGWLNNPWEGEDAVVGEALRARVAAQEDQG